MSQSSRARRAYVPREEVAPRRAAPPPAAVRQSNSRPSTHTGPGRRALVPRNRFGRRGLGLLAGGVAVLLVGGGVVLGPRLGAAAERGLLAVPAASTQAPDDRTPVPSPAAETAGGTTAGDAETGKPGASSTPSDHSSAGTASKQASKKSSAKKTDPSTIPVPATGPGTYTGAKASAASSTSRGRLYRFDVRVEKGLDIDADAAARAMAKTLNDKRSWRGTGRWRFELVPAGQAADLHAYLVTPGTTDKLCYPLLTGGEVSCESGNRVVLNAKRWLRGADAYGDDVAGYRQYLVNHEFGHALGHGHLTCPKDGTPAPVMLQQTKGLQGCTKNPWPMTTGD